MVAAPARASDPGVHLDPGSPAGKEYAIPLEQARGSSGSGPGGAALFGAGIRPAAKLASSQPNAQTSSNGSPTAKRSNPGGQAHTPQKVQNLGTTSAEIKQTGQTRPAGGGAGKSSATGLIAAMLLAVLAVGGLLAVVLRRIPGA